LDLGSQKFADPQAGPSVDRDKDTTVIRRTFARPLDEGYAKNYFFCHHQLLDANAKMEAVQEVLTLRWQWVLTVVNLATPMSNRVAVTRCCLYFALKTWLISFNILLQDLLKHPSASSKITKQRSHACG
jgi:hypothetical protein